ncbi:hypothetical protein SAMN00120144_3460 [Hymenobacter roseosalivarius DSM 11622]|uniref:Uncharacterized protein n=2 Tax=Hymenobacter roseosalivarius TaxID=89967 RepID=A0A1W1V5T6_9BACT|nr:hypothetical protein SAMN00120144_3460 [Hymenobacter roseosalivarius DSM 11622]
MTSRFLLLAFPLALCSSSALLAQDAPRELNTRPQPTAPAPAPARATPPSTLNTPPVLPDSVRVEQQRRRAAAPPVETTRFAVGLKDGRVFQAYDVETKQPIFGKAFLLLDGQQRFDLNTVSYYDDETGHYVRTVLPGRSTREATLRRDRVGRISLYSITNNQYAGNGPYGYSPYGYGRYGNGGFGGFGGPMYRTTKTEYFSKDNGPIEDLNLRNLTIATSDFAASRGLLEQARKYQTYSTLSYVAAGGLVAAGLFSSFGRSNGGPSISPLVYAGMPLLIVPLIMQGKQQRNIRQAITLYNRGNN